ncbi:unnamed protein product [Leuciscus chuanchicus]
MMHVFGQCITELASSRVCSCAIIAFGVNEVLVRSDSAHMLASDLVGLVALEAETRCSKAKLMQKRILNFRTERHWLFETRRGEMTSDSMIRYGQRPCGQADSYKYTLRHMHVCMYPRLVCNI